MPIFQKIFTAAVRILSSFFFDIRLLFSDSLRHRATASGFAAYRAMRRYPGYLRDGAALEAVRPLALKYCHGKGVDVGAGHWPLDGARAIDNSEDENAYRIREDDCSLDYLFSSHTLEHLERPWDAVTEWVRVLRPGGVLTLYLPHPSCEMWKKELLSYHQWSPDPVRVERELQERFGLQILYVTYLPDAYFSFVVVGRKKEPAGDS